MCFTPIFGYLEGQTNSTKKFQVQAMYYNKVILVISHYFQQLINSQKQRLFCTYELILHYSFSDKSTIVFLVAYTSNLCDTKHFT